MSNLSVKIRILGGFAIVIMVLIVVSGVGFFGFKTVNHEVDELITVVEEGALIAKIETEFLTLRSHTREFANLGREKDAEEVMKIAKVIMPQIVDATKKLEHQPEMLAKIKDLEHEFQIYIKDFAKAKILKHEFQALIHDKMEPKGIKIIEDIDVIVKKATASGNLNTVVLASTVREHALLTRLYANILGAVLDNYLK